jgi:hypothetical protein
MPSLVKRGPDLVLELDPAERKRGRRRDAVEEIIKGDRPSDDRLWDLLADAYVHNGEWEIFGRNDPVREAIGAMTDAPILSDEVLRDESGSLVHVGRVYWFPNYAVEDPLETLWEKGEVVFAGEGRPISRQEYEEYDRIRDEGESDEAWDAFRDIARRLDVEHEDAKKQMRFAAFGERRRGGGAKPPLHEIGYYTVIIPWSEHATRWHPEQPYGPMSKLSRGAFRTQSEAHGWARDNLEEQPYSVKFIPPGA